jgi:hypothetical protein
MAKMGMGTGVAPREGGNKGVGMQKNPPSNKPASMNMSTNIASTAFQPFAGPSANAGGAGGAMGPKTGGQFGQFKSPLRKAMGDAKRQGPSRMGK